MDKIYIFDIIDIIFSGGRSGGTYSIPHPARLNRYNNRKRDKRAEQRYVHSTASYLSISHHYVNMYANIYLCKIRSLIRFIFLWLLMLCC